MTMAASITEFAVRAGRIEGLVIVTPKQVTEERGSIREMFRRSVFASAGIVLAPFEQINITASRRGVIRGMHAEAMTKLVTLASGSALGAYVDLRRDSPTFGTVETVDLGPGVDVLVPSGVANGFQALDDDCRYLYCFDSEWRPGMAGQSCSPFGLGFDWPIAVDPSDPALVSAKDAAAVPLASLVADTEVVR